jgi:hypothetical protein
MSVAARAAGVARSTVYWWLDEDRRVQPYTRASRRKGGPNHESSKGAVNER